MSSKPQFPVSSVHERGSAVAEFLFTTILVLVLCASIVQVAFALHVRNTLIDCASEGARYAALHDSSLDEGVNRTRSLITSTLPDRYAQQVRASITHVGGQAVIEVEVHTQLPLLAMVGPTTVYATGRALAE